LPFVAVRTDPTSLTVYRYRKLHRRFSFHLSTAHRLLLSYRHHHLFVRAPNQLQPDFMAFSTNHSRFASLSAVPSPSSLPIHPSDTSPASLFNICSLMQLISAVLSKQRVISLSLNPPALPVTRLIPLLSQSPYCPTELWTRSHTEEQDVHPHHPISLLPQPVAEILYLAFSRTTTLDLNPFSAPLSQPCHVTRRASQLGSRGAIHTLYLTLTQHSQGRPRHHRVRSPARP